MYSKTVEPYTDYWVVPNNPNDRPKKEMYDDCLNFNSSYSINVPEGNVRGVGICRKKQTYAHSLWFTDFKHAPHEFLNKGRKSKWLFLRSKIVMCPRKT